MKWEELIEITNQRMSDPRVGDVFHEMYSYWVTVVARDGDSLVTVEGVGGTGKTERVTHASVSDFKARFAYETQPGYSIVYYDKPSTQQTSEAS